MPAIFPQIIVNGVLQRHVLPSFRRFQLSLFLTCNGYLYRRNQIAGKFNLSALLLSFHWQHLPMSSWQQISTHILKTNLCSPTEDLRSGPSKWVHLAATNSFWPALTNKNNIITHTHIMSSIFNSELPAAQWDTSGSEILQVSHSPFPTHVPHVAKPVPSINENLLIYRHPVAVAVPAPMSTNRRQLPSCWHLKCGQENRTNETNELCHVKQVKILDLWKSKDHWKKGFPCRPFFFVRISKSF